MVIRSQWRKCKKSDVENSKVASLVDSSNNILESEKDKVISPEFSEIQISVNPYANKRKNRKKINYSNSLILENFVNQNQEDNKDIIPEKLTGVYQDHYDLFEADKIIIQRCRNLCKLRLPEIENEYQEYKLKLEKPLYMIERNQINKKLETLEEEKNRILNNEQEYSSRVSEILEEYKTLIPEKKIIYFGRSKKSQENKTDTSKEVEKKKHRICLIEKYLEIASDYIYCDIIHKIESANKCPGCSKSFHEMVTDNEIGIFVCSTCGFERCSIKLVTPSSEVPLKSGYEDKENFYKAFLKYQGKQTINLPKGFFEKLDEHFDKYGLKISDEIKKEPLNSDRTRGNTTKDLMINALRETGFSNFYEDINLICHLYWNWDLPDVSHLEEMILQDYDRTQEVYNNMEKERTSSLNTQFRLFKHLEARGHKCNIGEFKLLKTRETMEYHESCWKRMCEGAGLPYIETNLS